MFGSDIEGSRQNVAAGIFSSTAKDEGDSGESGAITRADSEIDERATMDLLTRMERTAIERSADNDIAVRTFDELEGAGDKAGAIKLRDSLTDRQVADVGKSRHVGRVGRDRDINLTAMFHHSARLRILGTDGTALAVGVEDRIEDHENDIERIGVAYAIDILADEIRKRELRALAGIDIDKHKSEDNGHDRDQNHEEQCADDRISFQEREKFIKHKRRVDERLNQRADKSSGGAVGHADIDILAWESRTTVEDKDFILTVAATELELRAMGRALDKDLEGLADIAFVILESYRALKSDNLLETAGLNLVGDIVGKMAEGESVGAHRELEHKSIVVADTTEEVEGGLMVLFGLRTEASDDIGSDGAVGQKTADGLDTVEVPFGGIMAVHELEHTVATALEREMDAAADVGVLSHGAEEIVGEVLRMGGSKADAEEGTNIGDSAEELREVHLTVVGGPVVRVDILTEERDLAVALLEKRASLVEDRHRVAAAFTATGIRDDAIGAEVLTSAHDRDKSGDAIAVEADRLDVGIGLGGAQFGFGNFSAGNDLLEDDRKFAVGVGTYDERDVIFLREELILKALGHTSEDTNKEAPTLLESTEFAETLTDALFGIVADGAGVDHEHIGRSEVGNDGMAMGRENSRHDVGVGKIHLAAIGFEMNTKM